MVRVHNGSVTIIKQRKGSNPLKNTSFLHYLPRCGCDGWGQMSVVQLCGLCVGQAESGQYSQKRLSKGISFLALVTA